MGHDRYLIVGGGMTADAAARGIREVDASGSIAVISDEPDAPYARPPLSKALWKGDPLDSVWRRTEALNVTMHLGRRATALDVKRRNVVDQQGAEYGYDTLLLATGGTPRRLPFGGDRVVYFRTLADYRRVRALADEHRSFVVIGGGFIGSEIAAALTMQGCRVTMLFPEQGIGARVFPPALAEHLVGYFRDKGVDVRAGASVTDVRAQGAGVVVETAQGATVQADCCVAGIGIVPSVDLARGAGLDVEDGILVDETLQTSHAGVYAAGDVARFHASALGVRMRVEHEDNAVTMGRAAGRAMAGASEPYTHLPFFYSDLFDLGYEAVGDTDSRLEIVEDWKTPFREGVVYYVSGHRVRGALLWGMFGHVDAARAVIAAPGPFAVADLRGRIG